MSAPPWMLLRLALETRAHHEPADQDRLAMMSCRTLDEYRDHLVQIHGFETAVEDALARVTELDPSFVQIRLKVGRLRHDLMALGMTEPAIAVLPSATGVRLRSAAHALGWLFVLERHTLLAGLIRRDLRARLGPKIDLACEYLTVYGDTPGSRFRAFGEVVSAYARHHAPATVVAGAHEAFRAQRQWYRAHHPAPTPRAEEPTHRAPEGRRTAEHEATVALPALAADRVPA